MGQVVTLTLGGRGPFSLRLSQDPLPPALQEHEVERAVRRAQAGALAQHGHSRAKALAMKKWDLGLQTPESFPLAGGGGAGLCTRAFTCGCNLTATLGQNKRRSRQGR